MLYICGRLAENVTETRNKYDRKPKQYVYEKLFIHFFEKWKDEFKSLSFHLTISQENIKKSDFLKSALRYWKRVGKGTGKKE